MLKRDMWLLGIVAVWEVVRAIRDFDNLVSMPARLAGKVKSRLRFRRLTLLHLVNGFVSLSLVDVPVPIAERRVT